MPHPSKIEESKYLGFYQKLNKLLEDIETVSQETSQTKLEPKDYSSNIMKCNNVVLGLLAILLHIAILQRSQQQYISTGSPYRKT